MFPLRQFRR